MFRRSKYGKDLGDGTGIRFLNDGLALHDDWSRVS